MYINVVCCPQRLRFSPGYLFWDLFPNLNTGNYLRCGINLKYNQAEAFPYFPGRQEHDWRRWLTDVSLPDFFWSVTVNSNTKYLLNVYQLSFLEFDVCLQSKSFYSMIFQSDQIRGSYCKKFTTPEMPTCGWRPFLFHSFTPQISMDPPPLLPHKYKLNWHSH